MPIDPEKDTFIDLERGEQLKIEKDTDYLWRPKPNSANPIVGLTLEGGGRCFYYHLEDGAWYCSEYLGNLERIPEFKKRYRASEDKMREREAARLKWEEEKGGTPISAGAVNAGGTAAGAPCSTGPGNVGATSQRADHNMSMPQAGTAATVSGLEPESFPAAAQNQDEPHFPGAEATDSPTFPIPTHFPAVDIGTDTTRDELPNQYSQFPAMNMPRIPSFPPSFPFGPEGRPPLPPSFPSSFPFGPGNPAPQIPSFPPSFPFGPNVSAPQPPVYTSTSLPNHSPLPTEPIASANNADRHSRRTFIDGGEYVQVEGRTMNTAMDNSATMSGHGMNLNWGPDLHQERNGTYNVNWSH